MTGKDSTTTSTNLQPENLTDTENCAKPQQDAKCADVRITSNSQENPAENETNSAENEDLIDDKPQQDAKSAPVRRMSKEQKRLLFYTAREVAQILNVDEKSIRNWRTETLFGCTILPEFMRDHDGIFWYDKKFIDELATVFRKNWRTIYRELDDEPASETTASKIQWKPPIITEDLEPANTQSRMKKTMTLDSDLIQLTDQEKFILSAMLIREGECVPTVAAILDVDDFYRPSHRITYRAMLKIHAEGTTLNIVTLMEELRKTNELENVGITFAFSLTEYANTNASIEDIAKIVKEKASLRRVQAIAEKAAQDAAKGIKPAADIFDELHSSAAALVNPAEQFKLSKINDSLPNFMTVLKKMNAVKNLKTGFQNIDELQILLPGIYLIGAEPAIGKTDFVWQMLEQMARSGCKCIYASYEMDKVAMLRRLIARQLYNQNPFTPLTVSNLHENVEYPEHSKSIEKALATLHDQNLDLHILELYGQNVDSLIRLLSPLCSTDKPTVIAVDYLQNLASATNPENPKIAVDECLRKLKSLQNDTGAILFLVSSFNRANYRIPVSYASFKESGACEYFAEAMWGLQLYAVNDIRSNDKAFEIDEKISNAFRMKPRQIQLRCIKNRNGNTYDAYFNYFSANSYFESCDITEFANDDDIPAHIADSTSGDGKSNGNSKIK